MACVTLALLFVASYQDPAPEDRWIADLAHELVERRDQAARELWKTGAAALPAIRKALERGLHAGDARARKSLVDLERAIGESIFDAQARLRALQLVTFEDRAYRLEEVAADLERQTGWPFKVEVDASLSVRLGGKDRPLREVLDSIEEKLGVTIERSEIGKRGPLQIKPGRPVRARRIHLPGATFNVRRGPPETHGKLEGWVLETELDDPADATIGPVEVLGSDAKVLPLVTCRWCSPGRMFVTTKSKEGVRVRLRGNLYWNSVYELKVDAVEKAQQFHVGRYEISYEFLKTRVEPPPLDDEERHPSLKLLYKYKAGSMWQPRSAINVKSTRVSKTHAAWCGKAVETDADLVVKRPIVTSNWNEKEEIDSADLEGVRIFFSKPMTEPFDREIELLPSK